MAGGSASVGVGAMEDELPELESTREHLERAQVEYVQLQLATHFPTLVTWLRDAECAFERNEQAALGDLECTHFHIPFSPFLCNSFLPLCLFSIR